MARPTVFVGSSSEGLMIARAIQFNLKQYDVELWSQGVFELTHGTLEALVAATPRFDFAVLVVTPDDLAVSRGVETPVARDNVMFELGLFVGAIGRNRTFIVYDETKSLRLPSDLAGVVGATFRPHDVGGGNLQAAVGTAAYQIQATIERLGTRPERLLPESRTAAGSADSWGTAATRVKGATLRSPSLAAGSLAGGHQELFICRDAGGIFHRWDYGGGWSDWNPFDPDAGPFRQMSCSSSSDGCFEVFCCDQGGDLVHRWYRRGGEWTRWHSMDTPGPIQSLSSDSYNEGHQEIFVVIDGGRVYHRWQHGGVGWSGWSRFDAPRPFRRVACRSPYRGGFELFGIDNEGEVWHRWYSEGGSWSDWWHMDRNNGSDRAVALAIGGHGDQQQELFVLLETGKAIHRWNSRGEWSSWHGFSGREALVEIAAVKRVEGEQEVVAVTADGSLLHRKYRLDQDDWTQWLEMGMP